LQKPDVSDVEILVEQLVRQEVDALGLLELLGISKD
jgi:hypothetical protein